MLVPRIAIANSTHVAADGESGGGGGNFFHFACQEFLDEPAPLKNDGTCLNRQLQSFHAQIVLYMIYYL